MTLFRALGALILGTTTMGCVAETEPDPLATMSSACIRAIEMETNNHDIIVRGSDPRSGQWELELLVGGTGVWNCTVSQAGVVEGLDFLGSDGSPLA